LSHAVAGARAVIQARLARGWSPRPEPIQFAEEILSRDIENHRQSEGPDRTFFDRGVPDALCMLGRALPSRQGELLAIAARYPYHRQVFFLPPWEAIYTTDRERDQTFAEAVRVHESLVHWYGLCGYEAVEVPEAPVAERCMHVLAILDRGA
jgi:predicted ATPase